MIKDLAEAIDAFEDYAAEIADNEGADLATGAGWLQLVRGWSSQVDPSIKADFLRTQGVMV